MNHHKVESGVVDVRCSGRSEAKPSGLRRRLIISNKGREGKGMDWFVLFVGDREWDEWCGGDE